MLRYIIKFPSVPDQLTLASKHIRWFRSVSPSRRIHTKDKHINFLEKTKKRSISQPPTLKSTSCKGFSDVENGIGPNNGQYNKNSQAITRKYSTNPDSRKPNKFSQKKKSTNQYESVEQYELEAARPRDTQALYNVFEYISHAYREKAIRGLQHLQPSSLKPYGSTENSYFPSLTMSRVGSIRQPNKELPDDTSDMRSLVSISTEKDIDDVNRREYSTYNTNQSIKSFSIKENPGFQPPNKAAKLVSNKQCIKKNPAVRSFSIRTTEQKVPRMTAEKQSKVYGENYAEDTRSLKSVRSLTEEYFTANDIAKPVPKKKKYSFHSYKLPWSQNDNVSMISNLTYNYPETMKVNLGQRVTVPWPAYSERVTIEKPNLPVMTITYPNVNSEPSRTITNDIQNRRVSYDDIRYRVGSDSKRNASKSKSSSYITKSLHQKPSMQLNSRQRSYSTKCYKPLPGKRMPVAECIPKNLDQICPKVTCKHRVRADDNCRFQPKVLPLIKTSTCPCIEPEVPTKCPNLKRLNLNFQDPPKDHSCRPTKKCSPRADDGMMFKPRKLPVYLPGKCDCIEPPPLEDVPLVRLKAKQVDPPKRTPVDCELQPCLPRADQNLKIPFRELPIIAAGACPCIEPEIPDKKPIISRLKMKFPDQPKHCKPPPQCPPRADDTLVAVPKQLPVILAGECECVEPPPLVEVPIVRLKPKFVEPPVRKETCLPEPCQPRADDHLQLAPKKLPKIAKGDCPCVEPEVPDINPEIRRLHIRSPDPTIKCKPPIVCPPRADDALVPQQKTLPIYIPGICECIEPPLMTDVPLIRLKPKHVEAPKRSTKKCESQPCPPRADENLKLTPKQLPVLVKGNCPCVEEPVPDQNPSIRRLNLTFPEPLRVCKSKEQCLPRADDSLVPKKKRLSIYVPGDCECIEPPPLVEVPLIRLKPKHVEPPKHKTKKCKPPPCPRADNTLHVTPKELPVIGKGLCPCVEPEQPKMNPSIRRLKMKFSDPPRKCPEKYQCPERADNFLLVEKKNLPVYVPGECECLEPPPLADIPLVRLKKIKVTDPKRLVKKCLVKTCPRADDDFKMSLKELPEIAKGNCPCIEPEIPDKCPLLRRLNMKFPDQSRKCKESSKCLPRADDNLVPKIKKLSVYVPGYCECVESSPLVDVPLRRLKKNCNNELPKPDLCTEHSRADKGCWEFSPQNDKLVKNKQKKSSVNFNPKRRFNTNSFKELNYSNVDNVQGIQSNGFLNQADKNRSIQSIDNVNKSKNYLVSKPSSWPGLNFSLIQEKKFIHQLNLSRSLSTSLVQKVSKPKKKKRKKKNQSKPPQCRTFLKCPKFIIGKCATKNRENCTVINKVCCEKKPSPYPSFSECMHENLAPFSKHSQWRCDNRQYGFDPKIPAEKKYSTFAAVDNWKKSTIPKAHKTLSPNAVVKVTEDLLPIQACESNLFLSRSKCTYTRVKRCPKELKKKHCLKQILPECPRTVPRQPNCRSNLPYKECKKQTAPYPSFSDCVDDEIQENLTECPVENEKLQVLQPKYGSGFHQKQILTPPPPYQGKTDPIKEDKCVREKLCMANPGITQSCHNFGESYRPMRSKDYIKPPKNTSCDDKLTGANRRKSFCTLANENVAVDEQKRQFSTYSGATFHYPCIFDRIANSYLSHTQYLISMFGSNVQNGLEQNLTNITNSICKSSSLETDIAAHLGCLLPNATGLCRLITVKNDLDLHSRRQISTRVLSKTRPSFRIFNRFNKTKKSHLKFFSDYKNTKRSKKKIKKTLKEKLKCAKLYSGSTKNNEEADVDERDILQSPSRYRIHPSARQNCIKEKLRMKKPGTSLSCEDFGIKVDSKDFKEVDIEHNECQMTDYLMCTKNQQRSECNDCFPGQPMKQKRCNSGTQAEKITCTKKKDTSKSNQKNMAKCPMKTDTSKCVQKIETKCLKLEDCTTKGVRRKQVTAKRVFPNPSLWNRIMAYFKAREGCPTPKEMKQKRLMEKAEKAASEAGMCLIDPKRLSKDKALRATCTKKNPCGKNSKADMSCFPNQPKRKFATMALNQSARCYSSDWKKSERKSFLDEQANHDDKTKLAKKILTTFKEGVELLEERGFISPDDPQYRVYKELENLSVDKFNEIILKQLKINERDEDDEDESGAVVFSCKFVEPGLEDALQPCLSKAKVVEEELFTAFQDFCNKIEFVSCEDEEQQGKKNILDELNELLSQEKIEKKS